ncbi:MAG: 7,8-dihydro-6-hydroxymethylpterin-pyrophosphokinae [Microbacterium sp.]|nr:7,8-dihydro-6-hydroxymethylpterin-pyrophosphokinae [Microbacterium sp.]
MSVRLAHGIGDPPRDAEVPAVVALGANLGDRAETLRAAIEALRALPLTSEVRVSKPLETVAVTVHGEDADAPRYLNAVALVSTRLAPRALLRELHRVDERVDDEDLTVPHPRAHEREFVLAPWLDVDPDAEIPGRGRVEDLLRELRGAR